jgi:hypothetical protein
MPIVWILSYFSVFLMGAIAAVSVLTLRVSFDEKKKDRMLAMMPPPEAHDRIEPQLPPPPGYESILN